MYISNVNVFILDNNIEDIMIYPTKDYIKNGHNILSSCIHLFGITTCVILKPISAHAPQFTSLPKIHKTNMPMRPTL